MLTANQQQPQDGSNFFGSPDYIAPQVIKSQLNHPSRDIWSLGIIAYEIMIGVTPFTAMQVQQVFQNILKGEIQWPQIGTEQGMISQQAKQFIQALLEPNPYNRLGYGDITKLKQHKFFKNINWSNIRQHKPYFIPKHQNISLEQNPQLKQKLLERKTTAKSSSYFPSLGNIIRYDILKSKSSLKAKSTRKSRFKMQKQLNELKVLTSMDSFPPPIASSQKSLDSNLSSAVFQSQDHHSNTTIELNNVSYRSIQPGAVGTQRNEILQQNIQTIKQVPQNYEIKITTPDEKEEFKNS